MNEHVLTTEEVREIYVGDNGLWEQLTYGAAGENPANVIVCAGFDTWLEEVKREAQEQAWDEAIAAQQEVDLEWESYIMSNDNRMKPPKIAENPYRAA